MEYTGYTNANQASLVGQSSGGLLPMRDRIQGLLERSNAIRARIAGIGDDIFGPRPEDTEMHGAADRPQHSMETLIGLLEENMTDIESGLGRF